LWSDGDMVNHNSILVIRTSHCGWPEYRPKHVGKNTVNNMLHHRILTCILLVIYTFFWSD